jgi:hypothetical protein
MLKCGVEMKKPTAVDKVSKAKLVAHMRGSIEAVMASYLYEPVCEYTAQQIVAAITSVIGNYLVWGNGPKPTFKVVNTTTPFDMDQNRIAMCLHIDWGDGGQTHLTTQMVPEGMQEAVKEVTDLLVETLQKYGFKIAGKL